MKPTDDLHQLIRSLSKSEKRYFRLFASGQGTSDGADYLQLFDLLEAQSCYEEESVRAQLKGEIARYLPQAKHYLYKILIRSLNQFHAGKNADAQLNELIEGAAVLFQKRLYGQCRKLLGRARKLAVSRDRSLPLLQILTMEYRLAIIEEYSGQTFQEIDRIFDEMIQVADTGARRNHYWKIQAKMFALAKHVGELRSEQEVEQWRSFMADPLLAEGLISDDPISRLYCMFAYDHFFDITGQYEEVYRWRRAIVEYIESVPALLQRSIDRYIPALYNYCQVLIQTGRFTEFSPHYSKLRMVVQEARIANPSYPDLHVRSLLPRMQIERGEFSEALTALAEIEEEYRASRNSLRIGMGSYIAYLFAYAAFGVGDYPASLEWLGVILNGRSRDLPLDAQCFARLLNLIVHYELGNYESLEYLIPSARRFLAKQDRLFAYERCLLQLMGQLAAAASPEDKRIALREARDAAGEFRDDRFESQAFSHFDLLSWISSKLDGREYAEEMRRSREAEATHNL